MDLSEEKPECELISNDSPKNKGCKQKRKRNSSSEAKEPSRPIKQRKLEPLCGENTDETNIKFEGQAEEGAKSEDEDRGSGSLKKKKRKKRHRSDSFSKLSSDVFPEKCKLQRWSSSNPKLSDIEPTDRLAQKSETDLKSSSEQEFGDTTTQEKSPRETESHLENLSADEGIDSTAKDAKRSKRKRKKDSMDSATGSDLENVPKRTKYDRTEDTMNNNMQRDHSKDCSKKRRHKNRKRSKPLPHLRVISK